MIKSFKLKKRASQPKAREKKSEIATVTPKAIVKALYDYDSRGDDELSFRQQDFLYVVDNEDPEWFVACNPLNNTSGLVPTSYFEVIQRPDIPSVSLSTAMTKSLSTETSRPNSAEKKQLALYGFVLYDFSAERNDELEAKRGESIIIIAQSNAEWFVAKPIGRLGGPGLIPVSYVQLREVGTDKPFENFEEAIKLAGIPQVEEWKRRAAEYKASSIPLGRFEDAQPQQGAYQPQSPAYGGSQGTLSQAQPYAQPSYAQSHAAHGAATQPTYAADPVTPTATSGPAYIKSARVDRFAINGGRYWYLVSVETSTGKYRNLCRYYQDFYDFQIKLLEEFPEEAGRTGKQRTLPFMPGPLTLVNHSISSQRRANLDEYVRKLVCMPAQISRSALISQLFACRAGDIEADEPISQMPIPPEEDSEVPEIERPQGGVGSAGVVGSGAGAVGSMGGSGLGSSGTPGPAPLQQPQYQYQQRGGSRDPPALTIPAPGTMSSLATPSTATPVSGGDHAKVKVFHNGELIAIRVPMTLPFVDLYTRIAQRLGLEEPRLYLNKDCTGAVVDSDEKFHGSMVNGKIVLYAR